MPLTEKDHLRRRGLLWSRTIVPGWQPWCWDFVPAEGYSQALNDTSCNSFQLLRLDFSGFSHNRVFSLDIFKGHYFKLKSWSGERNYFHRIFTTQELNSHIEQTLLTLPLNYNLVHVTCQVIAVSRSPRWSRFTAESCNSDVVQCLETWYPISLVCLRK